MLRLGRWAGRFSDGLLGGCVLGCVLLPRIYAGRYLLLDIGRLINSCVFEVLQGGVCLPAPPVGPLPAILFQRSRKGLDSDAIELARVPVTVSTADLPTSHHGTCGRALALFLTHDFTALELGPVRFGVRLDATSTSRDGDPGCLCVALCFLCHGIVAAGIWRICGIV